MKLLSGYISLLLLDIGKEYARTLIKRALKHMMQKLLPKSSRHLSAEAQIIKIKETQSS